MAEFKISRFRYTWKGDWTTAESYIKDDVVRYGGSTWVCVRQHSASVFVDDQEYTPLNETNPIPAWVKMTDGYSWKGDWQDSQLYDVGDFISYSGKLYICATSHTSSSVFDTDLSNWDVFLQTISWGADWETSTRYGIGDVVRYNGIVYECIEGHVASSTLEVDQDKWSTYNENVEYQGNWSETVSEGSLILREYRKNDIVTYGGSAWICTTTHTVGDDSTINFDASSYWTLLFPGEKEAGVWNASTTYRIGDVVQHGGYVYYSLTVNYNSSPGASIYELADRVDPVDWAIISKGRRVVGDWDPTGTYKTGDVVRRGGHIYVALLDTTADGSSLDYLDSTNWELLVPGQAWRNTWTASTEENPVSYGVGDVVTFHGSAYICNYEHFSANENFPGDNGEGFSFWTLLLQRGTANVGTTTRGDILTYDLTRGLTGDGSSFGETGVTLGSEDQLLAVNEDGSLHYKTWGTTDYLCYVAPNGVDDPTDPNRGFNYFKPWKTIRFATERIEESGLNLIGSVKIKVRTGVYEEVLPIIVPANTCIQGEEVRAVTVKPNSPIDALSSDSTYTIQVLERISSLLEDVLTGVAVTPSLGNTVEQVIPADSASLSNLETAGEIQSNIIDIVNYINYRLNSVGTEPSVTGKNKQRSSTVEVSKTYQILSLGTTDFLSMGSISNTVGTIFTATTAGYGDGYVVETNLAKVNSVSILESNKDFFAEEAIKFMVVNNPSYNFDTESCKRDVRRFIDALKYDIIYTGNYKSILAARYYVNAVNGSISEDMFYVRDATGIRNMTLVGIQGSLTPPGTFTDYQRPTGGAYVSLDPGWGPDDDRVWINTRSCYVQNCCTFGYAAIGQKIDGDLHNGGNKSIVSNDFTQIISDGIGAWVLNGGRAELVSVFTYYSHIGYLAEAGGIIRATNGNNSYGYIGALSLGVDETEVPKTATVNTRNNDATVASAFAGEVNDEILILEFDNAGQNYTTANYTFIGSGINAQVVGDEFRDNGVFQSLRINPEFSGVPGGTGYTYAENNAQGGNATQIVLAASDAAEEAEYLGLRIIIVSGPGTGQYGYVAGYNIITKYLDVRKDSTGEPGWDHVISGYPILDTLLPATRYRIEPRAIWSAPDYSATEINTGISNSWNSITYSETTEVYTDVSGSAGTGTVIDQDGLVAVTATWDITKTGRTYTVSSNDPGAGYAAGQTVIISGDAIGGSTPENDITIEVTQISDDSTNSITGFTYSGIGSSGRFVAVPDTGTSAMYSSDGETWTGTSLPSAGAWVVSSGNNMFVAAKTNSSVAASSTNGIVWTSRTLPASRGWSSIAYGGGVFLAVSNTSGSGAYSTNGTSWTATTLPAGDDSSALEWVDVAYGKNKFVALANSDNSVGVGTYSGGSWTWLHSIMDVIADSSQKDWVSIAYGNNRFVAISSQGDAAYSFDGLTWYPSTMPTQDGSTAHSWTQIRYAQGVFFAVGSTGSRTVGADATLGPTTFAATSPDGIIWTQRTLDSELSWKAVAFGNPDVTLGDSTLGNSKPMWVAISSDNSPYINKVIAGATTTGRVVVQNGRVTNVRIWEPGSAYQDPPSLTLVDPGNSSELFVENRLGDGVLANPSWVNRGLGYRTSTTQVRVIGNGFADVIPIGKYVTLSNLEIIPKVGSQILFENNSQVYNAVRVTSLGDIDGYGLSATIQISPIATVDDYLEHGKPVSIREKYSQCRITGHDFLDVGTGNFDQTNYPELYSTGLYDNQPFNEVVEDNGGRVFYTSTDQNGNFRTGELFAVEQATGIVTISADFFDLSGLTELRLGGVRLGGTGVSIREFSTDPMFLEDSNNIIPTQKAIKAYLNNKLSVSGADLVGAAFTAGQIKVGPVGISNVLGLKIQVPATQKLDFAGPKANISGHILAQSFFYRSFKDDGQ